MFRVAGNKVATFTELDTDLAKKSAFSTLGNINLSVLTSHLLPEDDVQEVRTIDIKFSSYKLNVFIVIIS